MTKQEHIAEMAVIGCVRNPQAYTAEECVKCDFNQGMCNAYRHAEKLYNAGYQKLKQGKWLVSDQGRVITCSNCNKQLELYYPNGTEVGPALTYCPYCGSKNKRA